MYSDPSLVSAGEDANKPMVFTNVKSKPAEITLPVSKTLDGDKNMDSGKFSFQLKQVVSANGATEEQLLQTITNDGNGSASFDTLTFDTAGTYSYTISEAVGDNANIYYDETLYQIEVVVSAPADMHSGKPYTATTTITRTKADGSKEAVTDLSGITFNNSSKRASLALFGTKIIDVDKMPEASEFEFALHLVSVNGNQVTVGSPLGTGTNNEHGLVTFAETTTQQAGVTFDDGVLTFTKPGTYIFHASETVPANPDPSVLYDSTVHEIAVTVTGYENDPTYTIEVFIDGAEIDTKAVPRNAAQFEGIDFEQLIESNSDSPGENGAVFVHFANSTRHASVDLGGVKTLDRKTPAEGAFSFELKDAEGKVIETVANDAEGRFTFAPISLNWNSAQGASNQHVYYISEVIGDDATISYDKTLYRVTVVLEDPALTDPGLPIPATVKYEQVLDNGNYKSVDSPDFNNKTTPGPDPEDDPKKPVIPATGDSPLPWVLCGVAFAGLTLAFVAFRKTRRS